MFCNKCGSEIREDSLFCSYCGVPIKENQPAKANNPYDKTKNNSVSSQKNPQKSSGSRKQCAECGKELPVSTESNVCALCTIRRRNRELDEKRKNDDLQSRKQTRPGDRYDISDEFDQSVFASNRQNYYHEPESVTEPQYRKSKTSNGIPAFRNLKKQSKPSVFLIVIGVIIFFNVIGGIVEFAQNRFFYSDDSVYASSVWDEVAIEEIKDSEVSDFNDFESDTDIQPNATEKWVNFLNQRAILFCKSEVTAALQEFNLELRFQFEPENIYWEDSLLYIPGMFFCEIDGEERFGSFVLYSFFSENQEYPVYLKIEDTVVYDHFVDVTSDGKITENGTEQTGKAEGENILDEPLLCAEDFE